MTAVVTETVIHAKMTATVTETVQNVKTTATVTGNVTCAKRTALAQIVQNVFKTATAAESVITVVTGMAEKTVEGSVQNARAIVATKAVCQLTSPTSQSSPSLFSMFMYDINKLKLPCTFSPALLSSPLISGIYKTRFTGSEL